MNVALLISGGVDSAVACYQLVSHGIKPDLYYIKIGSDKNETLTCTAEEDIEMASAVANKFGLKLNVIDLHEEYWTHVVNYTMSKVKEGLTPNPDVMCNQLIKFGAFIDKIGHKYDRIATGHYGRIYRGEHPFLIEETLDNFSQLIGKVWLGTAADKIKDQTDFLCTLNEYQLSKLLLPIGSLTKEQVRKIADEQHLAPAHRKDSQGICFLGKINYADYVKQYCGEQEGDVIDIHTNRVLGKHKGYWFYTVGQRKGLGFGGGPWYVYKKDVKNNIVYVTNNQSDLTASYLQINTDTLHWFNNANDILCFNYNPVNVRIRHTAKPSYALFERHNNGKMEINVTNDLIVGAAPGQFCVIYDTDKRVVLGCAELDYANTKF